MLRSIKIKTQRWKLVAIASFMPALFFALACNDQLMAQQVKAKVPPSESNEVYMVVDQMPEYPGGHEALIDFLRRQLRYPKDARKMGIQGTSYIQFIVEKDGTLTNVQLQKGFDSACDAEAMKVVKQSKPWNPGVQNGKAVRTQMTLPINFNLN